MGAFVDKVPNFYMSIGTPWGEIVEAIDYTRGYANEMRDLLTHQIDELSHLIGTYVPDFSDVPSISPHIPHPDFPEKPDLTLDLNEDWPSTDIPEPIIRDVDVDLSYQRPTSPEDIDPSFDYTPGAYSSCIWPDLCSRIRDELINGGNGLTDLVYSLILDRNTEARRNAEEKARRELVDAIGERGFDLPGGMMSAAILEFEKDLAAKDLDAINSTTIKDFEMADANSRFIKELSQKIEAMLRDDFNQTENRLFEASKASVDFIIAKYEQDVKAYLAKWEGVKAQLDAAKTEIEAVIAQNESQIKIFVGRADVLKSKIEAIASENDAKTKAVQAEASVYDAEIRAVATQYNALVEEIKIQLENYKTQVSFIVEREKTNLQAYTASTGLAQTVASEIAKIASQSVASALGAINMGMSYGYQGSASARISQSLNNSLSESHTYQED